MYEYELFKLKPQESITDMTNQLNALLTSLMKLEKYFSKDKVNNKILSVPMYSSSIPMTHSLYFIVTNSSELVG